MTKDLDDADLFALPLLLDAQSKEARAEALGQPLRQWNAGLGDERTKAVQAIAKICGVSDQCAAIAYFQAHAFWITIGASLQAPNLRLQLGIIRLAPGTQRVADTLARTHCADDVQRLLAWSSQRMLACYEEDYRSANPERLRQLRELIEGSIGPHGPH